MDFLNQTITLYELVAWISSGFIFASSFRYIHSILSGHSKPNIAGWLLYQIATICVLISSYELGSFSTIIAALSYAICQMIIIGLAFRYGYLKFTHVETVFFTLSLTSLAIWLTIHYDLIPWLRNLLGEENVSIAVLVLNTGIDAMGAVAIFTKLYLHPETEDRLAWFLAAISGLFSILAVTEWSFTDLLYPFYLLISNLAIWMLCFRKKPRHRFEKLFEHIQKLVGREWR